MDLSIGALGTADMVRERLRLYQSVGINCLNLRLDLVEPDQRFALLEQTGDIANSL